MHAHCSQNTRTRHPARKAGNARRVKYTAVRTASTLADAKMRTVALTSIDRDSRIKRNENLGANSCCQNVASVSWHIRTPPVSNQNARCLGDRC